MRKLFFCFTLFLFISNISSKNRIAYIWNPNTFNFDTLSNSDTLDFNFEFDFSTIESISQYVYYKDCAYREVAGNILIFLPSDENFSKNIFIGKDLIADFFLDWSNADNLMSRWFDTIPIPYLDLMPIGQTFLYKLDLNLKCGKKVFSKETSDYCLHGLFQTYHENGNTMKVEYFDNGFPDSTFIYYETGHKRYETYYFKSTGFVRMDKGYRLNGHLYLYQDSELGIGLFFHENNLIEDYFQINKFGQEHGVWLAYDDKGVLKCKKKFHFGREIENTCSD